MNWGNKITLVITTFIIGMLSMVYVASKQTNEMFDGNYYEKELKYQQYIDASKNLKTMNAVVVFQQTNEAIHFVLPTKAATNISNGYIELLKADDSKKDVKQNIVANSNSTQTILKYKLANGVYTARVFWTNNNTPYYFEQKINITK